MTQGPGLSSARGRRLAQGWHGLRYAAAIVTASAETTGDSNRGSDTRAASPTWAEASEEPGGSRASDGRGRRGAGAAEALEVLTVGRMDEGVGVEELLEGAGAEVLHVVVGGDVGVEEAPGVEALLDAAGEALHSNRGCVGHHRHKRQGPRRPASPCAARHARWARRRPHRLPLGEGGHIMNVPPGSLEAVMRQALIVLMVLGACAPSTRSGAPPDFALAEMLAAPHADLARALSPAWPPWSLDAESLTRGASLRVRLPLEASAPFTVGHDAISISFQPAQASPARAAQGDGRVIYQEAWPSTDAIFTATSDRLEWFLLLHDDRAPAQFSWRVSTAGAIAPDGAGGLVLGGRLHLPRPFAVDAKGTRRDASLSIEEGHLRLALDTSGLTFPVLLDPLVYVMAWELRSTALTRSNAAMAFDAARGVSIVVGGYSGAGAQASTTHAWNGLGWTQVSSGSTSAVSYQSMAFDSVRNVVVLQGGFRGGTASPDTYTWNGTAWSLAATTGPGPRLASAMAFDSARGRAVLFGGNNAGVLRNDTWEWDGTSWTQIATTTAPAARMEHAMAFDSARNRVVLVGGGTQGTTIYTDTWEWDGATWTNRGNGPGRKYPALAFDSARNRTVLFGGWTGSSAISTTYEWDGTSWTTAAASGPSARYNCAAAFDSRRGRTVLLGGDIPSTGAPNNDTWEFYLRPSCTVSADCPAVDQCHTASCVGGFCVDANKPNGTACDDQNACTRLDTCQSGTCAGPAVTCTALDGCHAPGVCDPDGGVCSNPDRPDNWACNDSRSCTTGDRCVAGVCTPVTNTCQCSSNADCVASDQCHDAGTCTVSTGVCTSPVRPNGSSCDDGNGCTQVDACQAGTCTGASPLVCPAPAACQQAGVCQPDGGVCVYAAAIDGTTCDDGDLCTRSASCVGGACMGTDPVVCVALDACHDPGTCAPTTGSCSTPPKADDSPCSDGRACTTGDRCLAGQCAPVAATCACTSDADCTALDQCHAAGVCDRSSGVCSTPAKADGASCDDGDPCTAGDACQAGTCTPGAQACADAGTGGAAGGGGGSATGGGGGNAVGGGTSTGGGPTSGGGGGGDPAAPSCGCSGSGVGAWVQLLALLGWLSRRRRPGQGVAHAR